MGVLERGAEEDAAVQAETSSGSHRPLPLVLHLPAVRRSDTTKCNNSGSVRSEVSFEYEKPRSFL